MKKIILLALFVAVFFILSCDENNKTRPKDESSQDAAVTDVDTVSDKEVNDADENDEKVEPDEVEDNEEIPDMNDGVQVVDNAIIDEDSEIPDDPGPVDLSTRTHPGEKAADRRRVGLSFLIINV